VEETTYGDSGDFEVYETHEKPNTFQLVQRYQRLSGEWWQYQTSVDTLKHTEERFYEWHGSDGSFIYEDYQQNEHGWTYDYQEEDHATGEWTKIHSYSDDEGGKYECVETNTESYCVHCNNEGECSDWTKPPAIV